MWTFLTLNSCTGSALNAIIKIPMTGNVTSDVKPWGRWATLGLGLIALLGGQMVALFLLIRWFGFSLTRWSDLETDGVLVTLSVCIATAVQVALLVLMAWRTGAGADTYLGLTIPRIQDLLLGVITIAILVAAGDGFSWILGYNLVSQFQLDIYNSANAAGWLPWLLLTLVVVAPIGEETLFRGFLFRGWHRTPRDIWAVIIVIAALWALTHVQYNAYYMAQVFVIGLVFGWFRYKSGSTILTMLLHGLINLGSTVETFWAIHG
jgi:membrane protease YdiL (CAAX protease family)